MRRFWTAPERPLDEVPLDELEQMPVEARLARLERNDATTVVERRRIIGLQRSQLMGVLSLVALLIVFGYLYGRHINANSNATREGEAALRVNSIASCKRGNERTVDENRSHLDDYRFDVSTADLFQIALTQPHGRNPSLSTTQERADFNLVRRYVAQLRSFAARKTWKHLIASCEGAVDHPARYHLAPPIRFVDRMPPKGTLEVRSGE